MGGGGITLGRTFDVTGRWDLWVRWRDQICSTHRLPITIDSLFASFASWLSLSSTPVWSHGWNSSCNITGQAQSSTLVLRATRVTPDRRTEELHRCTLSTCSVCSGVTAGGVLIPSASRSGDWDSKRSVF